jgi:hypothetical protein
VSVLLPFLLVVIGLVAIAGCYVWIGALRAAVDEARTVIDAARVDAAPAPAGRAYWPINPFPYEDVRGLDVSSRRHPHAEPTCGPAWSAAACGYCGSTGHPTALHTHRL